MLALTLLTKLSKDFNNISKTSNPEISQEVIQYCLMMCNIIRRLKVQ